MTVGTINVPAELAAAYKVLPHDKKDKVLKYLADVIYSSGEEAPYLLPDMLMANAHKTSENVVRHQIETFGRPLTEAEYNTSYEQHRKEVNDRVNEIGFDAFIEELEAACDDEYDCMDTDEGHG